MSSDRAPCPRCGQPIPNDAFGSFCEDCSALCYDRLIGSHVGEGSPGVSARMRRAGPGVDRYHRRGYTLDDE